MRIEKQVLRRRGVTGCVQADRIEKQVLPAVSVTANSAVV
jgi:hypothetical protein